MCYSSIPANIRLDEDVFKTSWRRLSSSSSEDVFKRPSRRLDQDKYIRLTDTSSENVFKKSSRCLAKTSSRRLQDVFETSLRRLQDIFKTSSRRFENVFKRSSRPLPEVLQRCLQDTFKTYYQVKLFLLTQFQGVFETYLKRFLDVLLRRLSTRRLAYVTLVRNLWSAYKICNSIKVSQILAFHFTTPISGCLQRCIKNLVKHLQWSLFCESTYFF